LQYVQVFADRLADHAKALGQLPEGLSVAGIQAIQKQTTTRVGQGLEDVDRNCRFPRFQNLRSSGNGVPLPVSTRHLRLRRK
jgi:hypothetical protein